MGKVQRAIADVLIPEIGDRDGNRIRIYQKDNGEVVIHFRQMKITLMNMTEILEWSEGFKKAREELDRLGVMKNDL